MDLSDCLFVATANSLEGVAPALIDRMEVIELSSYTAEEKVQIAKHHLIPRQRKRHGITAKQLQITDKALNAIIAGYTHEAGVRNLERSIACICRKAARNIVELMSAWLCSLSQIVILWQHEFYQLALEDFKEWTIACKYAQSQDFLEDAVPFEDFLDYLINNCQNMDRQRYFLDNRYNLKIFTARIGGFSILHWLEMVYFRDKTKGIYDRDKALYFVNEYLGFAGLCGYDTNDLEFKNYIRSLINQYVPLEEYVAKEQESTLEI